MHYNLLPQQVNRNTCAYSFYIALSGRASFQHLMYIHSHARIPKPHSHSHSMSAGPIEASLACHCGF